MKQFDIMEEYFREDPGLKQHTAELEKLQQLHREGQVDKAKKGFLAYLKKHPQSVEALHALGLICVEQKKLSEAAEYLKQASAADPQNPTLQLHLANVLKMQGLFQQATTLLNTTVSKHPEYAPAFNNLGTLYYSQGKLPQAIEAYKKAVEKEPHYIDALYNLGLALMKSEIYEEAAEAYRRLLATTVEHSPARYQLAAIYMQQEKWEEAQLLFQELALLYPEHLETQVNLASCYFKQGRLQEAKKHYLKALALHPQDLQVLFNLGYLSSLQGNPGEALHHYQALLRLDPEHFAAHYNLGVLFFHKKQIEPALQHLQEALRIQPQHPSAEHLLHILQQDTHLRRSPPEYLKALFDYYADHYEPHLLNTLAYQTPQLLFKAFENSRMAMNKNLDILDLGCGTGLCGEVFKFHAAKLVGIDLSEKMLALAAEKKIYDALICADLIDYLHQQEAAFDLLVAGDVFVYEGDLSTVFQASKRALRPQGLLIFNTEISTREDYVLTPSGRFAHHPDYLEKIAKKQGFSLISRQKAVTRLQEDQPVAGLIYVLQAD